MKKFTKIAVVIAAVLVVVSLGCVMVSIAMGLTWDDLTDMIKNNKFNFAFDTDDFNEDFEIDIDLGEDRDDDLEQKVDSSFRNLHIEFGSGILKFAYSDDSGVKVQCDTDRYQCYVKEDTLHIETKKGIYVSNIDDEVTVILPRNMVLDEVDLEIGAGQVEMENLVAHSFDIEVGAGEAKLIGMDIKELDAKVGTGKLYAKLVGSQTDYNYEAEYGIGKLTIGNTSLSGVGGEKAVTNPGASKHLNLEGGIGEMKIEFEN